VCQSVWSQTGDTAADLVTDLALIVAAAITRLGAMCVP